MARRLPAAFRPLLAALLAGSALAACDYARMTEDEALGTYQAELPSTPPGTVPVGGGLEALRRGRPELLENPSSNTPETIARGRQVYGFYCVFCHGPAGDGNGTVGQSFAPLPRAFAEAKVQNLKDGELFARIRLGIDRMPPLGSTLSVEETWSVIRYLRTFAARQPDPKP
jgi:mono/diheme cytochrome c family protein